jgi:hypothetical protein
VPGSVHQGINPFLGKYTYTVTPRYFDNKNSMLPLDASKSVSVQIDVVPFKKGFLRLGFARGFTQSQAFVHHFGRHARIRPKGDVLAFDTSVVSGTNAEGVQFTFADEYEWLGFTAREQIFEMLREVHSDGTLSLDMFAYDLNEPDLIAILLDLAQQGRVRIILDDAALHHDAKKPKAEDKFEALFKKVKKGAAAILRGNFARYSHDKVLIVSNKKGPIRVLTGSTNFSITGIYVNSNHLLSYDDTSVAKQYADVFAQAWKDNVDAPKFRSSPLSQKAFTFSGAGVPKTEVTFAPHTRADAAKFLGTVVTRIQQEAAKPSGGSVLFAVMELANGKSPVWDALNPLHQNQAIFSYGISDSPKGIVLHEPGKKHGVLVSGRPASTVLPPPFDQVPGVGLGHQVHHKFVVCGFGGPDAVVFCGSSNLASGGEEQNGDNLLAIYDSDVATAFAIEALGLVDHFIFLDRYSTPKGKKKSAKPTKPAASPKHAAVAAKWFLSVGDGWTKPYFDPNDLKCADRVLFG